jgi:hypothetical protein
MCFEFVRGDDDDDDDDDDDIDPLIFIAVDHVEGT